MSDHAAYSIENRKIAGMEWNRWFAQLPAAGDYGTQKLMIFRKA